MRSFRLRTFAAGLLPLLYLASCSSSSGSGQGVLFIESCSLGCTNGKGGEQVFCSIVNTFRNQELSILFSDEVDIDTVSASTFRVVNVANGTTPVGTFLIDPSNSRRLIFRPDLTFDLLGNPEFGLEPNTAYQIIIPGEAQGDSPPYIRAKNGRPNQSRLDCTILTTTDVVDPVPGDPRLDITVDVVTGYDASGNPISFEFDVPASGAENVHRSSDIVLTFEDVMNVATLLNPSTGLSNFITVEVDADGDLSTDEDRVPVSGGFFYNLDLERLRTVLVFQPTDGYPSASTAPRRIVITVPESVLDLAGNPMLPENGGGVTIFLPEVVTFDRLELLEDFTTTSQFDRDESSGEWGTGLLAVGESSGSGRLGRLVVRTGETLVLDTDSQEFPLPDEPLEVIGNADVGGDFPSSVTITDGTFEFSSVTVQAGAVLTFTGSNPARLLSSGRIDILPGGLVTVAGTSASSHDGEVAKPSENADETNGVGGPNGGDGGYGADRFDATGSYADMISAGAITNPGAVYDGRNGGGVGRSDTDTSRGGGGVHYPADFPGSDSLDDAGDLAFVIEPLEVCNVWMVGNAGSGGGYALPTDDVFSESSVPQSEEPPGVENQDLAGTAGATAVTGLELEPPDLDNTDYLIRLLHPNPATTFAGGLGYPYYLRGGAGGGGGGMHPYGGISTTDFVTGECIGSLAFWEEWHDHSGGAGGGAGGGIQFRSTAAVRVLGRLDASGGDGGSSLNPDNAAENLTTDFASPGGGGSGGAILIQAPEIEVATGAGRLDVSGGTGGQGQGLLMIVDGGSGSPGLIRLEDGSSRTRLAMNQAYANTTLPFDDGAVDGDFDADGDYVGSGDSVGWLSVEPGAFAPSDFRPESYSSTISCWIRPTGNFFTINFAEDTGTQPDDMGWNMEVYWTGDTAADLVPFRGDNGGIFGGNDFETEYGNVLNHADDAGAGTSPICVRFQGVRITGNVDDLCDLDLNSANIVPGSVTPWVDHPAKLNNFSVQPNAIRFCVIFDTSSGAADADQIFGITNFVIRANPD